jgi:ankyrin repeat protein
MLSSNQILLATPLKDMLNKTPKAHPLRPLLEDMFRMQKSILKNKKRNTDLTNPLDTLVECNLIDEIDSFLARARELQIDIQYEGAAILAIEKNNKIALERLKDNGNDLSFLDVEGNNLLHHAVKFKKIEMILLLLNLGFNLNQKNVIGETPLHIAKKIGAQFARFIIEMNLREAQKKPAAYISMFSDNK